MKNLLSTLLILTVGAATLFAQQTETLLKTNISNVTIYLHGAELLQSAKVNLKPGKQRFIFTGLSPKLNAKSIQMTATNGVQVLSVTSKTNFLKESEASPAAKLLQDSLNLLKSQLQSIADEQGAYERERDMLLQNQAFSGKEQALTVEQLARAADFYRSRFLQINLAVSELKKRSNELTLAQARANNQLNQLNRGKRPTSEVYVDVETKNATASEFKLRYVVDEAGWTPVYDLVSTAINEPIKLKYRSLAFNNSGLDWNDVSIRLSTADPYQNAGQPTLDTWTLRSMAHTQTRSGVDDFSDITRPNLKQGQTQNYTFMHDLNPDIRYDKVEEAPNFVFQVIEISELSTDFDIPTPYTLPSDSRPYSIEIAEHQLAASYKHFAVPKLDKDAFLLAQVTGWEKLDLIAGPINVYRNENFIGMADLNPRTLSDTLELSLGRDANVVVKREKVREFSRKQFLGGNKTSSFSWKISVKNNHPQPINIEIQDQVPVSEAKEITVEVKDISGARRIENTGKLSWEFSLSPTEVKTVSLNFSVRHPASMEVEMEKMRAMVSPRFF